MLYRCLSIAVMANTLLTGFKSISGTGGSNSLFAPPFSRRVAPPETVKSPSGGAHRFLVRQQIIQNLCHLRARGAAQGIKLAAAAGKDARRGKPLHRLCGIS